MHVVIRALRANALLALAVVAVAGMNYYWYTVLAGQTAAGQKRSSERIILGTRAAPITAKGLDGAWTTLDFSSEDVETVLYVTSPTCMWCARNVDNIRTLAESASGRYRFIGLVAAQISDPQAVAGTALPFPVYTSVSDASKEAYRMFGTPQTLVIRKGVIVANWTGAYSDSRAHEIESFFKLKLPGLRPEATVAPIVDTPAAPRGERVPAATRGCADPAGRGFHSIGKTLVTDGVRRRCDASGRWVAANAAAAAGSR